MTTLTEDWEHGEDAATWPRVEYEGSPRHDEGTCIICVARRGTIRAEVAAQ